MSEDRTEKFLEDVRKHTPMCLAVDILSVQPFKGDEFSIFSTGLMSEKELTEKGYSPVSRMGLLWIKKEDPDGNAART